MEVHEDGAHGRGATDPFLQSRALKGKAPFHQEGATNTQLRRCSPSMRNPVCVRRGGRMVLAPWPSPWERRPLPFTSRSSWPRGTSPPCRHPGSAVPARPARCKRIARHLLRRKVGFIAPSL